MTWSTTCPGQSCAWPVIRSNRSLAALLRVNRPRASRLCSFANGRDSASRAVGELSALTGRMGYLNKFEGLAPHAQSDTEGFMAEAAADLRGQPRPA
jgi:hypothetical protein